MLRLTVLSSFMISSLGVIGCGGEGLGPYGRGAKGGPTTDEYALYGAGSEGWESLPVELTLDERLTAAQRDQIAAAAKRWNAAVGLQVLTLAPEPRPAPLVASQWDLLDDQINGIYLSTQWTSVTLGRTVYATAPVSGDAVSPIVQADVILNADCYTLVDAMDQAAHVPANKAPVDLESLALHELGHFLGLVHVNPADDPDSVMHADMTPALGWTKRELSPGDRDRIRWLYQVGPTPAPLKLANAAPLIRADNRLAEPHPREECRRPQP